jgi:ATP-binding cassette, subfamily C (CFTR/MRP), member 10
MPSTSLLLSYTFLATNVHMMPAGQQQLLCLARALLSQPKLVCLDECTANVDSETATLMQQVLAAKLQQSTVVQIAHRLDSIMECDWVFVMDSGRIVEQGKPSHLRADGTSRFAAMWQT